MSGISPLQGGNSPPPIPERVLLSVDKIRLKGKRKIDETPLEEEIEQSSKKQKTSDISALLEEPINNIIKIMPSLKQDTLSDDEKKIYNQAVRTLLDQKDIFIDSLLVLLPKLSTGSSENKKRLIALYAQYSKTSHSHIRHLIALHPDAPSLIKMITEKNVNPTKNLTERKDSLDTKEKIEILIKLYLNRDVIELINKEPVNIFQQIFPDDEDMFRMEKKKKLHIPFDYNAVKDMITSPEHSPFLMFLIERANPDIRKAILSKDKFFEKDEDNNRFITDFIEKYKDKPIILAKILNHNKALSSEFLDALKEKILQNIRNDASSLSDVIGIVYNNIKQNPEGISFRKNLELLVEFSKFETSASKGNSNFLNKLVSIGIELDKNYGNFDLFISLAHRDDVKGPLLKTIKDVILRPSLSSDDVKHNELLGGFLSSKNKEIIETLCKRDRLSTVDTEHNHRIGNLINNADIHDNVEVLIALAQRDRLSTDSTEHNQRIGVLIESGKSLFLCEEDGSVSEDNDPLLLMTLAQRDRLSTDDTEHNQRIGDLIHDGKEKQDSELLMTLAQRDRLSTDDTQNAQRFMFLCYQYDELRENIESKEDFMEMRDIVSIRNYNSGGA